MSGALVCLAIAATVLAGTVPIEDPIPDPIPQGDLTIALETVAADLTAPNWGTFAPGCDSLRNGLFVTDQSGILWGIKPRNGRKKVYLDVRSRLVDLGVAGPGTFDERGLLGVAFHPAFASNGLLYTYTSEPVSAPPDFSTMPPGSDPNHQSVVLEWQVPDPCNRNSVVDPASFRELLRIDEPQFNHDGGALVFGPDGLLYIALGDGGAADDQGTGHGDTGNGQDPSTVLGTILRIDPLGSNSANGQYGIPDDNPFVGMPGFADEIWAYGLRNPFRISFDRATGDLYIADVGQNDIEEIDLGIPGANYGWNLKEGSFCFDPNGDGPGFVFDCGGPTPDLVDPIAEYDHDEGLAVIGGFVYRGGAVPGLQGRYVFGEFARTFNNDGRLFYLDGNSSIREFELARRDALGLSLLGFAEDAAGELYVLANGTGVPFEETGVVLRIARERPDGFRAFLRGADEVPPIESEGVGVAEFRFLEGGTKLGVRLTVHGLADVVAAHIHCGAPGESGSPGVTLFSGGPVPGNGVLVEGTILAPDPGNGCGWATLADVKAAMEAGSAYVNVHTVAHSGGEIRGQVE